MNGNPGGQNGIRILDQLFPFANHQQPLISLTQYRGSRISPLRRAFGRPSLIQVVLFQERFKIRRIFSRRGETEEHPCKKQQPDLTLHVAISSSL